MTRRHLIAVAAAALTVTACGGDKPVPEFGTVVDREFSPSWVQVIPGTTSCSGNPPSCFTTPTQIITWPDEWRVTVRDEKNPEWVGTVSDGNSATYEACDVGELWPVCWKGSR